MQTLKLKCVAIDDFSGTARVALASAAGDAVPADLHLTVPTAEDGFHRGREYTVTITPANVTAETTRPSPKPEVESPKEAPKPKA